MRLEELPDDILLFILQAAYSFPSVLLCRRVCRRFRISIDGNVAVLASGVVEEPRSSSRQRSAELASALRTANPRSIDALILHQRSNADALLGGLPDGLSLRSYTGPLSTPAAARLAARCGSLQEVRVLRADVVGRVDDLLRALAGAAQLRSLVLEAAELSVGAAGVEALASILSRPGLGTLRVGTAAGPSSSSGPADPYRLFLPLLRAVPGAAASLGVLELPLSGEDWPAAVEAASRLPLLRSAHFVLLNRRLPPGAGAAAAGGPAPAASAAAPLASLRELSITSVAPPLPLGSACRASAAGPLCAALLPLAPALSSLSLRGPLPGLADLRDCLSAAAASAPALASLRVAGVPPSDLCSPECLAPLFRLRPLASLDLELEFGPPCPVDVPPEQGCLPHLRSLSLSAPPSSANTPALKRPRVAAASDPLGLLSALLRASGGALRDLSLLGAFAQFDGARVASLLSAPGCPPLRAFRAPLWWHDQLARALAALPASVEEVSLLVPPLVKAGAGPAAAALASAGGLRTLRVVLTGPAAGPDDFDLAPFSPLATRGVRVTLERAPPS
eukprot:tig00020965_g16830.t1